MTRFPALEGKEIVAVLERHGFIVERQRGSHCMVKHPDGRATVVPLHAGETIGPRDTDLQREEFLRDRKRKKKD